MALKKQNKRVVELRAQIVELTTAHAIAIGKMQYHQTAAAAIGTMLRAAEALLKAAES